MKIFTAVMGHWDVPGLITKSFTSAAKAEDWMLTIYREQMRDGVSLANSYRDEEGEPYLDENPETLVDLEDLIETLNSERDWAGVAELIESELESEVLEAAPEMVNILIDLLKPGNVNASVIEVGRDLLARIGHDVRVSS